MTSREWRAWVAEANGELLAISLSATAEEAAAWLKDAAVNSVADGVLLDPLMDDLSRETLLFPILRYVRESGVALEFGVEPVLDGEW